MVHRNSIVSCDRVLLRVGAYAGRSGCRQAVVVADEEVLEMVMRWDGYGGQLVDQGRDNLGRCGRGAYIIRRALAWSGIRCFDRRWERIAPSRLRRGSSGCCTVRWGKSERVAGNPFPPRAAREQAVFQIGMPSMSLCLECCRVDDQCMIGMQSPRAR